MPTARGPVSAWVIRTLEGHPGSAVNPAPQPSDDPLTGDDTHLALYLLYELHYRGVQGVDDGWEWDLDLLAVRRELEQRFEAALRAAVGELPAVDDVATFLQELTLDGDGPSLSRYLEEEGELHHFQEQAIHRAPYQLKEADPHSWALPRLAGRPKAALVEIQADEYGDGVEVDSHNELFALTLDRLGLSPVYNAYVDAVPGVTLAGVNLVTMFGLHRRLLGAIVGHLAVFEMTSVATMARHTAALRRLDLDPWTALFYDTHVVADAHHQSVAAHQLAAGLIEQDPDRLPDVVFGALALCVVEAELTEHILHAWAAGRSSLRHHVELPAIAPGQVLRPIPAEDPRPLPS